MRGGRDGTKTKKKKKRTTKGKTVTSREHDLRFALVPQKDDEQQHSMVQSKRSERGEWLHDVALTELLHFYRSRVDDFQNQRKYVLDRLDAIDVAHKDAHRVEWELQLRSEEIEELRRALSDAHVSSEDMRRKNSELKQENDRLRRSDVASRLRIDELLAIAPGGRRVGGGGASKPLVRDCRPRDRETVVGSESVALQASMAKVRAVRRGKTKTASTFAPKRVQLRRGGLSPRRVVRAVHVSSQDDAHRCHVEELERQLMQLRLESSRQIQALRDDRRILMEEERARSKRLREDLAETKKRLAEKETQLVTATRDYLDERHRSRVTERELREEINKHRVMCSVLTRELEAARRSASALEGGW